MASTDVSINQLPETNQITEGDFLIVQTPNATNRLDFNNFVVGLENTTFASTIEQHTTDIDTISANTTSLSSDVVSLSSDVVSLSSDVLTLSATQTDIPVLSARVKGIDYSDDITGTRIGILSAVELSASRINGQIFRGYPVYAQSVRKGRSTISGAGQTAQDLTLSVTITVQAGSKLRVSFSIPGSVSSNNHTAALILQDRNVGDASWSDITDFLATNTGQSQMLGTVLIGTDAGEEAETASFTGIYDPVLPADNTKQIRVGVRLATATSFIQNGSDGDLVDDGLGVSTLLVEEVFTNA